MFNKLDMEKWERREYFFYYKNLIKAKYNLNIDMDITDVLKRVKEKEIKFYPAMIYAVIRGVNENREFRISYDKDGNLGYWNICHPSYTIFHDDDKTFSDIWSEYDENFEKFYKNIVEDIEKYKDIKGVKTKLGRGDNFCPISCIPWLSFTGCANDTYSEAKMLFPVIAFGKYFKRDEMTMIPISVFVNHAVADGYHTCKLINDIQSIINDIENWI